MLPSNRIWSKAPGASAEALEQLATSAGAELPSAYFDLLAFSNGGEGPLQVSPYNFCLDSAEDAANCKVRKTYERDYPGFFMFGSNGGGEYIAFDIRNSRPWPVVAIDMTNTDLSESVQLIAKDFPSFVAFVGVERADA